MGMGMMPMMHPLMPDPHVAPLLSNLGTIGLVDEFLLHAIHGAVVGAMYGAEVHERRVAPRAGRSPPERGRDSQF